MRPHRRPGPRAAATVTILLLAAALVSSASAQAAGVSPQVSQKVYDIYTSEFKAQIAYSSKQMQANVDSAQTKLGSTASAIDALSSTNNSAATALVDELEDQYNAAGSLGLFKPALTAFKALSKLKLTHKQHTQVVAAAANIKRILAINTAADLTHWQAMGFAAGKEPADTKMYGGLIGISIPSVSLTITGSSSAIKKFEKLATKASDKTSDVFDALSGDWATWAAQFGIEAG